jgi:hypothetical protein
MIFRAVFWIGLVSLLTPHEPDLGLGRPGAGTSSTPSTVLSAASGLSRTDAGCGSRCAGGLGFFERMGLGPGGSIAAGLAQVKTQIDADMKARAARAAREEFTGGDVKDRLARLIRRS